MIDITFFTDPRGFPKLPDGIFPLVPYHTFRKNPAKWLAAYPKGIVDSGVYELKKHGEYQYIHEYPLSLPKGWVWIIPDYPHDMLQNQPGDECVARTKVNLKKWYQCPGAVPVFQFPMFDLAAFKTQFAAFKTQFAAFNQCFAIGNLCRLINNGKDYLFLKKVLYWTVSHNKEKYAVHIFGLPMRGIRRLLQLKPDFPVSFDSTKWTKGITQELKEMNLSCNAEQRPLYLDVYHKIILKEKAACNAQTTLGGGR